MKQSNTTKNPGLVLLNKPAGITSFQALGALKRKLGTGKVGHTGTLDSFAEGLLVVLVGRMTRLVPYFTGMDKVYEAEVRFGTETDTLDPEGEVIAEAPLPERDEVVQVLDRFRGEIDQVPPVYSAVHVDGKRAYQRVRAGEEVEVPSRKVVIHDLQMTGFQKDTLYLKVRCSKGTYIRSLARDIGIACGSRAHLSGLKRTKVGDFTLDGAVTPGDFDPENDLLNPRKVVEEVNGFGYTEVAPQLENTILQGQFLSPEDCINSVREDVITGVFLPDGRNLAFVRREGPRLRYIFVQS